MAGSTGAGGTGALTIGGIATVAIIVAGVVLNRMGILPPQEPAVEQTQVGQPDPLGTTGDNNGSVVNTAETASTAPQSTTEQPAGSDTTAQSQPAPVASETSQTGVETAVATGAAPEAAAETAATTEVAEPTPTEAAEVVQQSGETPTTAAQADTEIAAVAPETTATSEPSAAEPATAVPATGDTAAAPTTAEEAAAESAPTGQTPNEPAFVLPAPQLDVVRFDPDGSGIIAGRAHAGASVAVLLDGEVLDQVDVSSSGEFVSFASILPSLDHRIVSLRASFDGQVTESDATFILAPIQPKPEVVATNDTGSVAEAAAGVASPAVETSDPAGETTEVASTDTAQPVETADVADNTTATAQDVVAGDTVDNPKDTTSEAPQQTEVAAVTAEPVIDTPKPAANAAEVASAAENAVTQTEEATNNAAAVNTAPAVPTAPAADSGSVADSDPKPETETAPQPETVAVAVLKSDATGVELVQPSVPVVPELIGKIALDTIGYNDDGDVQLAGRASPASLVRVYLDNSPVADIRAATDGRWRGSLSDVAPGIYTLRLDELDLTGKVLSRLETPFKREAPEVLQPPAVSLDTPTERTPLVRAITVQKGDTLWAISRERYGDGLLYVRVFEANREAIRNPDLIYPGQVFSIPE